MSISSVFRSGGLRDQVVASNMARDREQTNIDRMNAATNQTKVGNDFKLGLRELGVRQFSEDTNRGLLASRLQNPNGTTPTLGLSFMREDLRSATNNTAEQPAASTAPASNVAQPSRGNDIPGARDATLPTSRMMAPAQPAARSTSGRVAFAPTPSTTSVLRGSASSTPIFSDSMQGISDFGGGSDVTEQKIRYGNGGKVSLRMKPRMVHQPGYKNSGKVYGYRNSGNVIPDANSPIREEISRLAAEGDVDGATALLQKLQQIEAAPSKPAKGYGYGGKVMGYEGSGQVMSDRERQLAELAAMQEEFAADSAQNVVDPNEAIARMNRAANNQEAAAAAAARNQASSTDNTQAPVRGSTFGNMLSGKIYNRYGYGGQVQNGLRGGPDFPKSQGPIGNAEADMGQDEVDAVVRPGEYLLNPDTVAAFGKLDPKTVNAVFKPVGEAIDLAEYSSGDYDRGVRNLNKIARNVTGREPGPKEMEESGTMGFAAGGTTPPKDFFIDEEAAKEAERNKSFEQRTNGAPSSAAGDADGTTRSKRPWSASTAAAAEELDKKAQQRAAYEADMRAKANNAGRAATGQAASNSKNAATLRNVFGSADEWAQYGDKAKNAAKRLGSVGKLLGAGAGMLGGFAANQLAPLYTGATGVRDVYQGIRDDDYAKAAKGGLDVGAAILSYTPAKKIGQAYSVANAAGDLINPFLSERTKNAIGAGVTKLLNPFDGDAINQAIADREYQMMMEYPGAAPQSMSSQAKERQSGAAPASVPAAGQVIHGNTNSDVSPQVVTADSAQNSGVRNMPAAQAAPAMNDPILQRYNDLLNRRSGLVSVDTMNDLQNRITDMYNNEITARSNAETLAQRAAAADTKALAAARKDNADRVRDVIRDGFTRREVDPETGKITESLDKEAANEFQRLVMAEATRRGIDANAVDPGEIMSAMKDFDTLRGLRDVVNRQASNIVDGVVSRELPRPEDFVGVDELEFTDTLPWIGNDSSASFFDDYVPAVFGSDDYEKVAIVNRGGNKQMRMSLSELIRRPDGSINQDILALFPQLREYAKAKD